MFYHANLCRSPMPTWVELYPQLMYISHSPEQTVLRQHFCCTLLIVFVAACQATERPRGPLRRRFPRGSEIHRSCCGCHLRFVFRIVVAVNKVAYDKITTGFSFSGAVREPFSVVIQALEETTVPVTAVDAPSSWSIEDGPPASGVGSKFNPAVLVSLTAPKPLVKHFKGRHFIGGRFATSLGDKPPSPWCRVVTDLSLT